MNFREEEFTAYSSARAAHPDNYRDAKRTISRLQGIVSYQRDRIVKLYKNDVIDQALQIIAKQEGRT